MFEISQLNEKKLSELQEIAQKLNVPKYRSLKKSDLVYQILDHQATNPKAVAEVIKPAETTTENKPAAKRPKKPRARIQKPSDKLPNKKEEKPEETKAPETKNTPVPVAPVENKAEEKPNSEPTNKPKPKPSSENKPRERDNQKNHQKRDLNPNKNPNKNQNNGNVNNSNANNGNKDSRNRYREPDFEFDAIIESEGVLDIMQDGYGFLRSSDYNYLSSPDDIYVSQSQIRLFGLKKGDTVLGHVRPPKEGEKYFPLIKVIKINGQNPDVVRDRVSFEHLTPLFPKEKFNLAERQSTISTRIMDLFSPLEKDNVV